MDSKPHKSPWFMALAGVAIGGAVVWMLTRNQGHNAPQAATSAPIASAAATNSGGLTNSAAGRATNNGSGSTNSVAGSVTNSPLVAATLVDNKSGVTSANAPASVAANPAAPEPYRIVFCLAIGIMDYPAGWNSLAYGEKDAVDISGMFSNRFNFRVKTLTGKDATKARIEEAVQRIQTESTPEDDVLIFFSGHGATLNLPATIVDGQTNAFDRAGFLVPYDPELPPKSTLEQYQTRALDMRDFAKRLLALPARHRLLFVDTCYSSFAATFASPRNKIANDSVQQLLRQPTVQVITTGMDMEEAPAKPVGLQNSVLTHALLQVLNAGGIQSGDEMYFQVRKMVRDVAYTNSYQLNPQRRYLAASSGDFIFIPPSHKHRWMDWALNTPVETNGSHKGYYLMVSDDEVKNAKEAAEKGGNENDPAWQQKVDRYETRASMGDPNAAAALVHLYGRGLGTRADGRKAYMWAREGYDTRTPAGRYALGVAYQNGYGVPQNQTEANILMAMTGLAALQNFGVNPGRLGGMPFVGGPGGMGGPGDMAAAAGMAVMFMNMYGNKPDNPLFAMDDRRRKVQERFDRRDWRGVDREITDWRNEAAGLMARISGNPAAEQLKPQVQKLQEFLFKELAEMQSSAKDQLKNATQNSLNRVQQELGSARQTAPTK